MLHPGGGIRLLEAGLEGPVQLPRRLVEPNQPEKHGLCASSEWRGQALQLFGRPLRTSLREPELADVGEEIERHQRGSGHAVAVELDLVLQFLRFAVLVQVAQAAVDQTKALADNAQVEAERRQKLGDWASEEERQTFMSRAMAAQATHQQAVANLAQAQVNLKRTRIESPVNGYVTNLQAQLGDYVMVGERRISVVNSDSFWIDGYFEETVLGSISIGDPARAKLMGYSDVITGHVAGVARGIDIANASADEAGLAKVNPIFTWVRLAQRVPVRIALDHVPESVRLVAGMTATVQIDPAPAKLAVDPAPAKPAP